MNIVERMAGKQMSLPAGSSVSRLHGPKIDPKHYTNEQQTRDHIDLQ